MSPNHNFVLQTEDKLVSDGDYISKAGKCFIKLMKAEFGHLIL